MRPTSDRVKEALFSILGSLCGDLDGVAVLDIFAGTGSLGIEALSRGAGFALFIDNHRESVSLIGANLNSTGLSHLAEVVMCDARSAVKQVAARGKSFDLVLADPPYAKGLAAELLAQLASPGILNNGAVVVIETGSQEELPDAVEPLHKLDQRIYGDTALTFYSCH